MVHGPPRRTNQLLLGVGYFLCDPLALSRLSRVCKSGAKAVAHVAPLKRHEFVRFVSHDAKEWPVLPNGAVHGIVKMVGFFGQTNYHYNCGKRTLVVIGDHHRFTSQGTGLDHVLLFTTRFIVTTLGNIVSFTALHHCRGFRAYRCNKCQRYHCFISMFPSASGHYYCFSSMCDARVFKLSTLSSTEIAMMFSMVRRRHLRRAVCEYAKRLK